VLLASLAGGWALTYSFRTTAQNAFDARLTSLLNVLIGLVEVDARGQLELARSIGDPQFDRVYSGWYWLVIEGDATRLRSRSLWDLTLPVPTPGVSATPHVEAMRDPLGRDVRTVAQSVLLPGKNAPVTFVVTGDLDVLRAEYRQFDWMLRIALGALALGLLIAVLVQVHFGLRPLRRLAHDVQSVRTGNADHLPSSGTRELDLLVDQVNSLIEHNRHVVERARASASDLAHALKTPLAIMQSVEPGSPDASREQREQIAAMERMVTRHLARASAAGPGRRTKTPIAPIVEELTRGLGRVHADRQLEVARDLPTNLTYAADREDLEEMIGNLIENAYKWARSRIRIAAIVDSDQVDSEQLVLIVEDDGPGIDGDPSRAIARGTRLDETTPGSGLGLSIVTDIASIYGGQLRLEPSPLGGLRATLCLPLSG
jgi:signal transduction histidine kinase